jgi:tetratricopeptide (TPR) repeat protein
MKDVSLKDKIHSNSTEAQISYQKSRNSYDSFTSSKSWLKIRELFKKKKSSPSVNSLTDSIKSSLGTIDLSSPDDFEDYDVDYCFHDPLSLSKETVSSHESGNDYKIASSSMTQSGNHLQKMNQVSENLFQEGKLRFSQGFLTDALMCQEQSLNVLSANADTHHPRQEAMILYEISRIKYELAVQSNEHNFSKVDEKSVCDLRENVENYKIQMALENLKYYQEQLSSLEDQCVGEIDVYKILETLHTLGKICGQDLYRLEQAQFYYKRALSIEEQMYAHMIDDGDEDMAKDWAHRMKRTRRKYAAIQYQDGRFDLALLSVFST